MSRDHEYPRDTMPDFTTPDLSDVSVHCAVLPYQWRHFGRHDKCCGPISTIACFEDNSRVAEAVAEPGCGRILLVDGQGSLDRALLGDRLAELAVSNGWAGIVLVGAVRDVEIIDTMAIGVWALGVCPRKTEKRDRGDRDIGLHLADTLLEPGYWLYADRNGVLVSDKPLHFLPREA
jgi:regulator of ribonuclease activity A